MNNLTIKQQQDVKAYLSALTYEDLTYTPIIAIRAEFNIENTKENIAYILNEKLEVGAGYSRVLIDYLGKKVNEHGKELKYHVSRNVGEYINIPTIYIKTRIGMIRVSDHPNKKSEDFCSYSFCLEDLAIEALNPNNEELKRLVNILIKYS